MLAVDRIQISIVISQGESDDMAIDREFPVATLVTSDRVRDVPYTGYDDGVLRRMVRPAGTVLCDVVAAV